MTVTRTNTRFFPEYRKKKLYENERAHDNVMCVGTHGDRIHYYCLPAAVYDVFFRTRIIASLSIRFRRYLSRNDIIIYPRT